MSAKAAKDKGNASFKAGDYAVAVGHYSAAIVADRTDPTLPLNRAAAYLKLGKNEDAERDCTTVLSLPAGKNNVKALFRRAQARVELRKLTEAVADLNEAAGYEPNNDSVKAELARVQLLLPSGSKPPKMPSSLASGTTPKARTNAVPSKPYRRRVPITMVDDLPTKGSSGVTIPEDSLMSAITSRSLKTPGGPKDGTAPAEPKPAADPWAARDIPGRRIGGGILKKQTSGSDATSGAARDGAPSKVSAVSSPTTPAPSPSISSVPTRVLSAPRLGPQLNLLDFTRTWNATSPATAQWDLLKTNVIPSSFPALFSRSLEPPILASMLKTFKVILEDEMLSAQSRDGVLEYLRAFPTVPRFEFVVGFLSGDEQQVIRDVWKVYEQEPGRDLASGWKL